MQRKHPKCNAERGSVAKSNKRSKMYQIPCDMPNKKERLCLSFLFGWQGLEPIAEELEFKNIKIYIDKK